MVLLTGGTGLIGGLWLSRVAKERSVLALARRPERITAAPSRYNDLSRCIDASPADIETIVHSAADIRFNSPLEQSRANNVIATQNLLRFAERCPKLRQFVLVSTAYVAGDTEGLIPEKLLTPAPGFFSTYQQTKHEAEQIAVDAMRRLPVSIFRLSSVIGARSGEVHQWNYFHQLLRLAPANALPVIPARPDATIDVIPADWAVDAMCHIVDRAWKPGMIYHVCGGPARAVQVQQAFSMAYSLLGKSAVAPRVASLSDCDAYYVRSGERRSELWNAMRNYVPHLALRQTFDNTNLQTALSGTGLDQFDAEDFLMRVIARTLGAGQYRSVAT